MKEIFEAGINILIWIVVYNPMYLVGAMCYWIKEGWKDGYERNYMQ